MNLCYHQYCFESTHITTNRVFKIGTGLEDDLCDPDEKVLKEIGLVDLVFPNDKGRGLTKHEARSFEDKLCEFFHYQPLTSHKDIDVLEAIKVCSPEGRKMLKEALETPYMEAYYTVSPQVDNQPASCCGTMSLVVALNSLDIDPARATWKEEWRWNHLGSLACCTPILQNPNICLDQFACLAVCNDMRAFTRQVTDDWTLHDFRCWVKMAVSRSDMVMVVNHGRKEMNQKGSGHFLPMTGYHEGKDMILLYDIAKFKYVPQWIPLQMMFNAVRSKDDRSGVSRGFALLMCPDYQTDERMFGPSIIFRIDDVPGNMDPRLKSFVERWNSVLDENIPKHRDHQEIIKSTILNLLSAAKSFSDDNATPPVLSLLEMTLRYFKNRRRINNNHVTSIVARCRIPQCPSKCPNTLFRLQIEAVEIFQNVREVMESIADEERAHILEFVVAQLDDVNAAVRFAKETSQDAASMLRTVDFFNDLYCNSDRAYTRNGVQNEIECPGYIELFPEHIATFILLLWPYYLNGHGKSFGHDAFMPVLKEKNLPHLDSSDEEKGMKLNVNKARIDENSNFAVIESNKIDEKTSVREYLNQVICHDLEKILNYRILNEQIRGIKRKVMTVLDYHNI